MLIAIMLTVEALPRGGPWEQDNVTLIGFANKNSEIKTFIKIRKEAEQSLSENFFGQQKKDRHFQSSKFNEIFKI